MNKTFFQKKVVVFDLDGTLTKSKTNLDGEMALLLCRLLEKKKVMVIGGGSLPQFRRQFLNYFPCKKEKLKNLILAPTSGASMYQNREGKWQEVYRRIFTKEEKRKILSVFMRVLGDIQYERPKKVYGNMIEDRESQITFSALGQKAPLAAKTAWNKKSDTRARMKKALEKYLPKFEVRLGGLTSVDVTKKGIDKAYGVKQLARLLKIPVKEMVYVGDALYRGGNDVAVKKTDIFTFQVQELEDTKRFVRTLLKP